MTSRIQHGLSFSLVESGYGPAGQLEHEDTRGKAQQAAKIVATPGIAQHCTTGRCNPTDKL